MRLSTPHGQDFFHRHDFFQHGFWGPHLYDDIGIHRGWLAALGVLYIFLGIVGFSMAALATLATVVFFGVLAIVGGIVQLVASLSWHGTRNQVAGAVMGALYIFAGLLILYNPVVGSLVLTLLLAGALVALGIMRIAFWMQHRAHRYWVWSIISGSVSILLGFLIMAEWPLSGLWVIGLFVSLEMIFHGAAAVGLAMENRRSLL